MNQIFLNISLININRFYNFNKIDIGNGEHNVNDNNCPTCYDTPEVCECGGIIHSDLVEVRWDQMSIKRKCDKCLDEYFTD